MLHQEPRDRYETDDDVVDAEKRVFTMTSLTSYFIECPIASC